MPVIDQGNLFITNRVHDRLAYKYMNKAKLGFVAKMYLKGFESSSGSYL